MSKPSPFTRPVRRALAGVAAVYVGFILLCAGQAVCLRALVWPGMVTGTCPSGDVIPGAEISAWSLARGAEGTVSVTPLGWFTGGPADDARSARLGWGSVELALVSPDGTEQALSPVDGWSRDGAQRSAGVVLPAVPDGDYLLRARVSTLLDDVVVDAPLPLYAPARAHLLTDRPLYEAGHTVQFRALTLRAADRAPLAERPGVFQVTDPDGLLVFEERAETDAWGIAASDLPLDPQAASGPWRLTWRTGETVTHRTFDVRPFTLPRFTVEAAADRPWAEPGESPTVTGRVVFASGAPVGDATLAVDWSVQGPWPMPTAWAHGALPTRATTDAQGGFTLDLPEIPADLVGQATLVGRVSATSPAGDTERGAVRLLLSADPLQAEAVTELEGGLVEGFNNRVYLRVTTPDGQPVREAAVTVRPAWDPRDPGVAAETDIDGVAALQLDPGPAVNVVVPAQPLRPPVAPDPVTRAAARDLSSGEGAAMADLLPLDRLLAELQGCARFVTGASERPTLGLSVGADGRVREVFSEGSGLSACLAARHAGLRLSARGERVLRVGYLVSPPDRPGLDVVLEAVPSPPTGLERVLDAAAADARRCLPADTPSGEVADLLTVTARAGATGLSTRWTSGGRGGVLSAADRACVRAAVSAARLERPASADAIAVARLRATAAPSRAVAQPQPTTMLGYAFSVSAEKAGESLGETTLRLRPGVVPPVRLRADPVLATAGQTVTVEVLRGPDLDRELPDELELRSPDGARIEAALDPKTRTAAFALPAGQEGWFEVSLWDAVARVYVAPAANLEVAVAAGAATLAPGETATLTVTTTAGGQPVPAGVSLVGVDATLGQLAPLPGAGDLDDLRAAVETDAPAFDALDGQALAMGRVRGANAAAATVLRVSRVPAAEDLETPVSAHSDARFDPVPVLTDRFYAVLAALHARVRVWETSAPEGEQMTPARMAGFWREARGAVEAEGGQATDAYGRALRLSMLPADLLALTDPRQVVVDGTRLPEDVERWDRFVAEEDPR